MFKRKQKTEIVIPEGVDWARRASPYVAADLEGYLGRGLTRRADEIARENVAYLRAKAKAAGGLVVGYHGTTSFNANRILRYGFENRMNEEGREGVSVWDEVAPMRAIDFAVRRSREAEATDNGMVLKVTMTDPRPDVWHGRLEWLADARRIGAIEVYTPEHMVQALGGVAVERIHHPAA